MTKLRVLYVAHNHPSVRPGGAEEHALEVHRAMSRSSDVESILLVKGGPPVGPVGRIHDGTHFGPVGTSRDEYFFYTDGYEFDYLNGTITDKDFYTKHFRDFLRAIKPDVVHFQHTLFLGYDMIREVHHTLPDVPIVYTLHEYLPICARDGQMVRAGGNQLCEEASPRQCHGCFPNVSPQAFFLRKRFIQSHFELVDAFLAPSHFLMQRYVEWGIPPSKISFEDYGRAPATPVAEIPRAQRNRIGFFGQFSPYKGVDVLLEAMKLLATHQNEYRSKSTGVRTSLALHGTNLDVQEGEFQTKFKRLLEESSDNVSLAGRYNRGQLPTLMSNIDWVVVPSIWWENSPLVIQEAFLNRRPVICSDIGGMAEKVTHGVNGLHFKVADPVDLARVLQHATNSPGLWDQLHSGIPDIYTIDAHVARLKGIYRRLLTSQAVPDGGQARAN
jgi:glycosyltransferase involved in cell wall biosynthesis